MTTTYASRNTVYAKIGFVYHPDGVSHRGMVSVPATGPDGPGGTSICKHAHATAAAAIQCGAKKRAAWKRGEWS